MATVKSAYDFLAADEETALDYVDIFLPDNLEDQLSEKIDNPFYVVDGMYDPSSGTDMAALRSAIDEMLSNFFGKGRYPVKTDVIAGGGSIFRFGPTVLRPITKDLEMKYVTSDGLTIVGQPKYQLESQNRLLKLEDCLPSRKITRKELQDLYFKNTNIYHGFPAYLNKMITTGLGDYGNVLSVNSSGGVGFPANGPVDNSFACKTVAFPIGIRRNNKKAKGPDKDGRTKIKIKLIMRPYNNMVGEKVSDQGNSDITLNGIESKIVRLRLKEVYGTASDIFQEMNEDGDVDAALDCIKIVYPEGSGCIIGYAESAPSFAPHKVFKSKDTPVQVYRYVMSYPNIYMDVLVPRNTEIESSKDYVITTGSSGIDIWAGLDNIDPFGGALSGPETVATSNSQEIGKLTVPQDEGQFLEALTGNHSIVRSRAYENLSNKGGTSAYTDTVFCEAMCVITLYHVQDVHTVMVFSTYNPYDIITSTHFKPGSEYPVYKDRLDVNKLKIADNRINLSSDIFDIFGMDIRLHLEEL